MKQMIFYSVTEAELFDPKLSEKGLKDVKAHGFDSIYLEYRNQKAGLHSPRFDKGIANICKIAKRMGLKVSADLHYRMDARTNLKYLPEIFTDSVYPQTHRLKKGQFQITLPAMDPLHFKIERAYLIQNARVPGHVKAKDVTSKISHVDTLCQGGGCAMTTVNGQMQTVATYKVKGHAQGELFVLVRHLYEYKSVDPGHPHMRPVMTGLMDWYKDKPIQGFMWDEPQYGFAFFPNNGRAISTRLEKAFKKKFGYALSPRLVDLWFDVAGQKSGLTRLHFAELLESGLADLEQYFYKKSKKWFNKPAMIGMHRTMHEELSDDFFIGCVDYFRHNRFTSDGFTDSVFERDDSMINMIHLARSMAPLTPGKEAWNNSWGFRPTEQQHGYYLPLMGALGVRWIGHTYHGSNKFGPGYPDHPLWKNIKSHLKVHGGMVDQLEGATPLADTAVLFSWPALATYAGNYLQTHRRNMTFLSRALSQAQVQFMHVSEEVLAAGQVNKGKWSTKLGDFSRVVIPWADFLDKAVWKKLQAFADAGGEVLVFGPPPSLSKQGKEISGAFVALTGVAGASKDAFTKVKPGTKVEMGGRSFELCTTKLQKNYGSNPVETYPDHFKLFAVKPAREATVIARAGRKTVGVQKGSVTYLGLEMPHYKGLPAALMKGTVKAPAGMMVFTWKKGGTTLLSGVGYMGKRVSGTVTFDKVNFTLKNHKAFVARVKKDRAKLVFTD